MSSEKRAPGSAAPLLTVILHEGGMVTIDKRGIVNKLMRGLEYKGLGQITVGLHEFLGQLIELCLTSRLLDTIETPVMNEPRRPQ